MKVEKVILFNDYRQPVYAVAFAYGGGAITLKACSECGAVVVSEENQRRHRKWHQKVGKNEFESTSEKGT